MSNEGDWFDVSDDIDLMELPYSKDKPEEKKEVRVKRRCPICLNSLADANKGPLCLRGHRGETPPQESTGGTGTPLPEKRRKLSSEEIQTYLRDVVDITARAIERVYGIQVLKLKGVKIKGLCIEARQILVYLLIRDNYLSRTTIARLVCMDASTTHHSCARVTQALTGESPFTERIRTVQKILREMKVGSRR